jgi:hypothetical protein
MPKPIAKNQKTTVNRRRTRVRNESKEYPEFYDLFVGEPLGRSADFWTPRSTLRGMKRILYLVATLVLAGIVAAYASASSHSSGTYIAKSVHLPPHSTASFNAQIPHPKQIILYGTDTNLHTSTVTMCLKGTTVSTKSRSFDVGTTRNMLYQIPPRQDMCYLSVAGVTGRFNGRLSVQVTPR